MFLAKPFYFSLLVSVVVILMTRTLPAYFSSLSNVLNYPRFILFLDYSICLITGEIVYYTTYHDIALKQNPVPFSVVSGLTLVLAAFTMHKTQNLTKSFGTSLLFFFICLLFMNTFL